jgi:hypothetical protein
MKSAREYIREHVDTSPEGVAYRDKVVAIAKRWADGDLTIDQVRRECRGYERDRAVRATHPDHSDHGLLMTLLDELIATEGAAPGTGGVPTKHGFITNAELREHNARVRHGDGRILLPIQEPWRIKPTKHRSGVRADPVYAENAEERARIIHEEALRRRRQGPDRRSDREVEDVGGDS